MTIKPTSQFQTIVALSNVRSPHSWRRVTSLMPLLALLTVLAVNVTPAFAESPWWHLSSSSRPTYLQPGQAKDEVQQVTVSASLTEPYRLVDAGAGLFGRTGVGRKSEPLESGDSPQIVQHALEEVYGAGDVEVASKAPFEAYEVKFVHALADQPVALMHVETTTQAVEEHLVQVTETAKGRPDGEIVLTATNLGDAIADPEGQPITIGDVLPSGLHAVAIEGAVDENSKAFGEGSFPLECSLSPALSCAFTGIPPASFEEPERYPKFVPPYELIRVRIGVNLQGAGSGEANDASVTGGGAAAVSAKEPITVSAAPPPFGVSTYEIRPEAEGGAVDTQAGSHPFQLTTTFNVNESFGGKPIGLAKDLHFKLPPGLIGNPTAVAQCTMAQFLTEPVPGLGNECPAQSVVGVENSTINVYNAGHNLIPVNEPVYNLEPAEGEPARFGFIVEHVPVLLSTKVRAGGDYGVTVNVSNITEEVEFLSSEVTFWGVPGDESHNESRGFECLAAAREAAVGLHEALGPKCAPFSDHSPAPFLSLPTSCLGGALETSVEADSWEEPHNVLSFFNTAPMPTMDGCNHLPFEPQITVTPDGHAGSAPTGLNVDVHVPQDSVLSAQGLAESNVKDITVTLPEGVAVNPASGDGLEACSEGLVGFTGFEEPKLEPGVSVAAFTPRLPGSIAALAAGETAPLQPGLNFCANASKIGEVTIKSPLLPAGQFVKGFVYLADQEANPFGSLVAMYIVAEDKVSGTLVKLPGVVHLTPSGQIVSTFENNPQLAFEDAELHFFGGERAPLASPAHCGAYTTSASFTPWAGEPGEAPHTASSTFDITSNCTPQGQSQPFAPSLDSLMTDPKAGVFSSLSTTISRADGQQDLQSVQLKMPPGLSGLLSDVKLCPEPEADQGTCGPESQIGETIVSVGLGGDPFSVTGGKVFITGPYNGKGACTVGTPGCAPFGLSIVNPAKAGPFDLADTQANHPACDCVLVRARVELDPLTTALTVTTDSSGPYAIPHILEGIPLQIKHVNVTINRPGFTINPTNCSPLAVTGGISSAQGANVPVSDHFEVTNCAKLQFAPKFSVSTSGKTSKAKGASLTAKVTYPNAPPGSYANITKVKVELPKALPSRLTTLQKACTNAQFELNPANCPAASRIGYAVVHTPLLPVPLEGPAIFVSHGGEAFPSLTMVLQGYGLTVDLVGTTFISKASVTSTTFKTVPDQPFSSFELTLPEGPYSALTAIGNLCAPVRTVTVKKMVMVKVHGHIKKVTRKVRETRPAALVMPNEFIGQNGAQIHENTDISVTGCGKAKKTKKVKPHKKGKKK